MSAVVAQQGDIALEGTDVKILAKENQSNESWSSRETNTSHELFNTSGSPSLPTHGQSDEKGGSNASNYSNSYVGANGNLSIKSKNDTTVKGALVEGRDVDLDIGGDLTVASVQNTGTGQSDSEGYNLGGTTGYNTGESNANRNWTDTQTHIIGTNQLDIKAEKLSLEGALLANAEIERNKEGFITNLTDGGNLKIKVNTLEIKDLKDSDEGSNQAYGVNVSGFTGYPQVPQGGSTQLNAQTSGHKKKGHTRATIGQGEIVTKQTTLFTADPTQTEINRDLGNRQDVTEDKTTGGLDISLDMDNRLATDTGNYVADSVVNGLNVFGNGVRTLSRTGDGIRDIGESIEDVQAGRLNLIEAGQALAVRTDERQRAIDKQKYDQAGTEKVNNLLEDGTKTDTQVQEDIQNLVSEHQDALGVSKEERGETSIYDGGESAIKGYADKENQNIGINIGKNGTDLNDGSEVWEITTHEAAHTVGEDDKWAHIRSEAAGAAWSNENRYNGNTTGQGIDQQTWVQNQYKNNGTNSSIFKGTVKAARVKQSDPYIDLKLGGKTYRIPGVGNDTEMTGEELLQVLDDVDTAATIAFPVSVISPIDGPFADIAIGGTIVGAKLAKKVAKALDKAEDIAQTTRRTDKVGDVVKKTNKYVDLTDDKGRKHILDGDGPRSGGHRYGTSKPGKTEFPKGWTDEKILHEVSDVATDPSLRWTKPDPRGYVSTMKQIEGVDVKIIFDRKKGRVVSAYPTNTPRNPR